MRDAFEANNSDSQLAMFIRPNMLDGGGPAANGTGDEITISHTR
jgi:hypothetical protein